MHKACAVLIFAAIFTIPPAATAAGTLVTTQTWRGPAGITVTRSEARVEGVPVHGIHQAEMLDARGTVIATSGGAAATLERLASGELALDGMHLKRDVAGTAAHALRRTRSEPVWYLQDDGLRAAYREYRIDLLDSAEPLADLVIRDAETSAVLEQGDLIHRHAPHGFYVYAHPDGRPLLSPFGQTWPHPTGIADGWVPSTYAVQSMRSQGQAIAARNDAWLASDASSTAGNNAMAFFNSVVEPDGRVTDMFGPRWGPEPDTADGDFLAHVTAGTDFVYPYDPSNSVNGYFQWLPGMPDGPSGDPGLPDTHDPALNAKIVQAFYNINWLHDFLYRAGFDEAAGNAQQSNYGRGGIEGDPIIVHSGFLTTFIMITPDGESPVMALGINDRSMSWRDGSMDFTVTAHEIGHHLVARTAGLIGPRNHQGSVLHEGIADFLALLVGVSAGDDFRRAFPVGQYYNLDYLHRAGLPVVGVTPDALFYGVRRYPYSMDAALNPLLFSNLAVQPPLPFYDWKGRGPQLNEVHTAGEIFASALFQCFGELVATRHPLDFESVRVRMAQYLVGGLMMFPERPTLLEARNAILGVAHAVDVGDYIACRRGFAARGLGAGAVGPHRESVTLTPAVDGFLELDNRIVVTQSELLNETGGTQVGVQIQNTGILEAQDITVTIMPLHPSSVRFDSSTAVVSRLLPGQYTAMTFPVTIDASGLPKRAGTSDERELRYVVHTRVASQPPETGTTLSVTQYVPGPPAKSGGGSVTILWVLLIALCGGMYRRAVRRSRPMR